jgi:hypothetical protein
MSPSQRKRSSAFEDIPDAQPASQPVAESPLAAAPQPALTERIERLKPSQMLPDRFQPRRLLPANLRAAFFSGKTDCYNTAAAWLALSRVDNGVRLEVERLLAMGSSFELHGQIKPITGSWLPTSDGRYVYVIETGERRFWAACLRYIEEKAIEEPLLRVEVVEHPTRQRQVLENRHAEPPSAVSQACEVAALILSELGMQPDVQLKEEYDYFRQARAQRMPAGLWEHLMPVMQLTRPRMVQLLNILQMPNHLLEMADRFRLPERVLREVLALPSEQWERTLRLSIQHQLTSDDVAEISGKKDHTAPVGPSTFFQPGRVATSGLRRFANALVELDEISRSQAIDQVADELVGTNQAEGMINLLSELTRSIDLRVTRLR